MTPALRWVWVAGAATVGVGLLGSRFSPDGAVWFVEIGLVVVAIAGGVTAGRGAAVGRGWLAVAWFVPLLPIVAGAAVALWLASVNADPLAVVLVFVVTAGVAVAAWVVFAITLAIELVRLRRRRFGASTPAWKNDAIPPPSS